MVQTKKDLLSVTGVTKPSGGGEKMNKKILKIFGLFLSVIAVLPFSTVFTAKPMVNNDVWFVAAPGGPPEGGESWWTGDGTILHQKGFMYSFGVFRSPQGTPPGSVPIGSMTAIMETFVFNTKTSKGRLVHKLTISLVETDSSKNPYGVGTLEGTLVVEVTSLHPGIFPGDGTGLIVATHGTGAFENAKLKADVSMMLIIGAYPAVFTFFGTHWNVVEGCGTIVYR